VTVSDSLVPTATAVLAHVVKSIVDAPDAVVVDATATDSRVRLEVKVGPGDLGRVIGRRGRTAQSIRTVVRAAAVRGGPVPDVADGGIGETTPLPSDIRPRPVPYFVGGVCVHWLDDAQCHCGGGRTALSRASAQVSDDRAALPPPLAYQTPRTATE